MIAKSRKEFDKAAEGLLWLGIMPPDAEVVCIDPTINKGDGVQQCIIRLKSGLLHITDFRQACLPCAKLHRPCAPPHIFTPEEAATFPEPSQVRARPAQASSMTYLRRAGTICSQLYDTVQTKGFDAREAVLQVRTAIAHLHRVEALLESMLDGK
jgi:hypothetical protein